MFDTKTSLQKPSKKNCYELLSQKLFSPGDVLFLDLDEILLFCKQHEKYTAKPLLAHPKLPGLLKKLQSQGIICIGLSARDPKFSQNTKQQLEALGICFSLAHNLLASACIESAVGLYQDGVFYAPSQILEHEKTSRKGIAAVSILKALKAVDERTLAQCDVNPQRLAKRIFVLDDLEMNLKDIEAHLVTLKTDLSLQSIELCLIHNKPLFVSNKQDKTSFPDDLSKLSLVQHIRGGSGGVYVLKSADGNQYTFKAHKDLNHLQEELISDALYQAVACPAPDFAVISEIPVCLEAYDIPRNGIYRLAQFIACGEEKVAEDLPKKELAKHFLVDALLANWDIAVGNFKNTILDKNNTLYRIDNGGALRYKAKGDLKQQHDSWSAYHVKEFNTLRDPQINKDAAEVYGSLSSEELLLQHEQLLQHAPALFETLTQLEDVLIIKDIEELRTMLAERFYDLEMRLQKSPHPYAGAFESLHTYENNSASILVTATVNGVPSLLLGQRIRHKWYSNVGGKSERGDGDLFTTASREAAEETAGLVNMSLSQLEQCPSHDLITEQKNDIHTHRMFIAKHHFVSGKILLNEVRRSNGQEYTHFDWVPIEALLAAIKNKTLIQEEGSQTLEVRYTSAETEQENTITLFPAFAVMLQQAPIKEHLEKIARNLSPLKQRTRSHANTSSTSSEAMTKLQKAPYGTYPNSNDLTLQNRLKETVYPDPKASQRNLIKTIVASSLVNQEIKGQRRPLRSVTAGTTYPLQEPIIAQQSADTEEKVSVPPKNTQSIAHLQGLLQMHDEQKPEQLVGAFFKQKMASSPMAEDKTFQTKLIEAVKAESTYPNRVVLYHTTNSRIGFYYDLISSLRSLLVMEDIRSLRTFDDAFKDIDNVEAFLVEQCKKQGITQRQDLNNFQSDYQEKGLSCNFSLFGNHEIPTSSSIEYFHNNSSSTNNEKTVLIQGMTMLLKRLNIKSVSIEELTAFYDRYEKDLSPHLYQIFIEEDQVDEFCYFASNHGRYHDFTKPWLCDAKEEEQHKLLPVIKALKENPHDFLNNEEIKKQTSLQARLYMHPRLMHDRRKVAMKTYKMKEMPALFKEEMSLLMQRMASELLQYKQGLQLNYQGNIQGQAALLPLQRKYAYVMQGAMQQDICYGQGYNLNALYEHLQSGNLKDFEKELESLPEGADLHQIDTDFSGKAKRQLILPLIYDQNKNNHKGMLTILLKSKHCTIKFLNYSIGYNQTLLDWIMTSEDHINLLIANKACQEALLKYSNTAGDTFLQKAFHAGQRQTVKMILQSEYCTAEYLQHTDNEGNNLLNLAVKYGQAELVQMIVENKYFTADYFKHVNIYGDTVLTLALSYLRPKYGMTEIGKIILNHPLFTGESLSLANKNKETVFSIIAKKKYKDILQNKTLLLHTLTLSEDVQIQLFTDCFYGEYTNALDYIYARHRYLLADIETNKSALTSGQQIQFEALKQRDHLQKSLFGAAKANDLKRIAAMLEADEVDINTPDEQGSTLLMLAVQKDKDTELAKLLLAHGAGLFQRNHENESLLKWCFSPNVSKLNRLQPIKALLLSHMISLPLEVQERILSLSHQHDKTILDYICSCDVLLIEEVFLCSDRFSQNSAAKEFLKRHCELEWTRAVKALDIDDVKRLLSLFPEFLNAQFLDEATALEYWIKHGEDEVEINDGYDPDDYTSQYHTEAKYNVQRVNELLRFILSKEPDVFSLKKALTMAIKMRDDHYELLLNLLKSIAYLSLDHQKYILGSGNYSSIFDFAQKQYPKYWSTLLTLPNIEVNEELQKAQRNLKLSYAVRRDDLEATRQLLLEGADIQIVDEDNCYPLLTAVLRGNKAMMDLLLQHNACFKTIHYADHKTILNLVLENTKLQACLPDILLQFARYSLQEQSDFLYFSRSAKNLLEFVIQNHPNMLPVFLKDDTIYPQKNDPKRKECLLNKKLLRHVCQPEGLVLMEALLTEYPDFLTYSEEGTKDNLLLMAMQQNADEVVRYLIVKGVNGLAVNNNGQSAFDFAQKFKPSYLPLLLSKALQFCQEWQERVLHHLQKSEYVTMLAYVCKQSNLLPFIVDELSQSQMPQHQQLELLGGDRALFDAIKNGNLPYVKTLIALGANLSVVDQNGNTALMEAVKLRAFEAANCLLEAHAPLDTRNSDRMNVFELARYEPQFMPKLLQAAYNRAFDEGSQEEMLQYLSQGKYKTIKAYQMAKYAQIVLDRPRSSTTLSISAPVIGPFFEQKTEHAKRFAPNSAVVSNT